MERGRGRQGEDGKKEEGSGEVRGTMVTDGKAIQAAVQVVMTILVLVEGRGLSEIRNAGRQTKRGAPGERGSSF